MCSQGCSYALCIHRPNLRFLPDIIQKICSRQHLDLDGQTDWPADSLPPKFRFGAKKGFFIFLNQTICWGYSKESPEEANVKTDG